MRIKCEICDDDGKCLSNKNHPEYDEKYSSIYDCCCYVDEEWMVKYAKRLQKKNKTPYISNFCKWSKNV